MRIADRLSKGGGGGGQRGGGGGGKRPPGASHDFDQILATLHSEVVDRLDIVAVRQLDIKHLTGRVAQIVDQIVVQRQLQLTPSQRERIVVSIVDEISGLGPIEPLLADPTVSDILVNTADMVYVERNGILELTKIRFRDNGHLQNIITRIVAQVGRRIDESSPMVDARLPDGSRVNAIIPPLAIDGPLLSIRRFGTGPTSPKDLARNGTVTENMLQFLRCAVRAKCNILVSGGTGAGKTTLLNALSNFISQDERILTIEDAAELRLQQQHVGRLETRPPNIEGKGEVSIRDLVRNSLRMRPDRIIVGECRSSEVLDMIQAMNTGHEGSMTTVHANNDQEAITRLMSMLAMAGTKLSETMMLEMLSRSIHLIVSVARNTDGRRRVMTITEVGEVCDGQLDLQPVFHFDQYGVDESGRLLGEFRCSGHSALLGRFRAAGVPLHPAVLGGRR